MTQKIYNNLYLSSLGYLESTAQSKILHICQLFFESLNSNNIRYCHWKSNSHLEKALAGKTDLDILVHKDDKREFELLLEQFDMKRILSPPEKRFPDIKDYLGFDYQTGSLIHLHIHYRLILGQKYIKNHHLPIEDIIFQNLALRNSVFIPIPEIELILLIMRAHMKADLISIMKHGIRDLFGNARSPFPYDIEEEFIELIYSCDMKKLCNILYQFNLPLSEKIFFAFMNKFLDRKLRWYDVLKIKWEIMVPLKAFRRQKRISLYLRYLFLIICHWPVVNKLYKPKKKTLIGNGKMFSIVGADGSGKSTLATDIERWLSWKLSVRKYYFGIPKTNFPKIMSFYIRLVRKLDLNYIATLFECYFWFYVAKKRYHISKASQNNIKNGKVVITDRFALKEFHSMKNPMDGPRLRRNNTRIGSFFSKLEERYYDRIMPPDGVFVLRVSIEELRRRKTDLDLSAHKIKANAVNAVRSNRPIIVVDANRSYPDVLLDVKRQLWKLL
ncbi:MAG: hypothetical protein ACMUIP_13280 [bacterium]